MDKPQSLPFGKKIIFACGNFGWSLATFGVANLITYFYMPNIVDGKSMFPPFIFKGAVFIGLTVLGLIIASGRLFDAITDPLIASMSDRSKNKFGKRRIYMAIGGLPMALLSLLVFTPPSSTPGVLNGIYIAVTLFLFYLFFTIYVSPYSALVSEYGHSPDERLDLSTIMSVAWALGFLLGNVSYTAQGIFEGFGFSPLRAFQLTMGIFALLSLITLYLPVIFIDERKYSEDVVSEENFLGSLWATVTNKIFLFFLFSELLYWFALTFIQTGISYYVVTLLGFDKSLATILMIVLFLVSFLLYVPINLFAKKFGKKMTEIIGFSIFALTYLTVFSLGQMPIPPKIQLIIVAALGSLPMAIFGIIPVAIIADIAEADGIETGNYKTGVFFAMRGLFMKIGSSTAGLVFPSIIIFGSGEVNALGIRMTAIVALVFCILGVLVLFFGYNEKHVLNVLATHEKLSDSEMKEIS